MLFTDDENILLWGPVGIPSIFGSGSLLQVDYSESVCKSHIQPYDLLIPSQIHCFICNLNYLNMSSNASDNPIPAGLNADHSTASTANGRVCTDDDLQQHPFIPPENHSNAMNIHTPPNESDGMEPIAIIGLSLRFPQDAISPQKFWRMLMEKRSAMTDVPTDRFNVEAFFEEGEHKTGVVRYPCTIRKRRIVLTVGYSSV